MGAKIESWGGAAGGGARRAGLARARDCRRLEQLNETLEDTAFDADDVAGCLGLLPASAAGAIAAARAGAGSQPPPPAAPRLSHYCLDVHFDSAALRRLLSRLGGRDLAPAELAAAFAALDVDYSECRVISLRHVLSGLAPKDRGTERAERVRELMQTMGVVVGGGAGGAAPAEEAAEAV